MPESASPVLQNDREERDELSGNGNTSIRVNVSLLDSLMNLAGELVLCRNQLLQTISSKGIKGAEGVGQRIDLITSELQEAIMLTRMQPVGNVFDTLPGLVRELAKKRGKSIELGLNGKDVELDKTIIEAIHEPLTQLVGNAVEHGIEPPEERLEKGKHERAKITLGAFHEAGQVVIEIEDDGRGLDGDKLAALAVSKGLITQEQGQGMSEKEKIGLIFQLGSQMSENLDGSTVPGAGLSTIRDNLDKLGGQIDVSSELDKNTRISIKLPLTLAIIPCQVIQTEGERYAIPQVNLEELLRIPAHRLKERIEIVGSAEVVRLRGKLLPLVRLADVLNIERTYYDNIAKVQKKDRRTRIADRRSRRILSSPEDETKVEITSEVEIPLENRSILDRRRSPRSALNIVVVSAGSMTYGLIVDELQDSEEIVIKPLGRHLQDCRGYAGATIMGDGRIALIIDVSNLAVMAGLAPVNEEESAAKKKAGENRLAENENLSLLIFSSSEKEHFAIPLEKVERIEKIKKDAIEYLGSKRVVQYRNGSLSLISMDDVASVQPIADKEELLAIVFQVGSRPIGLLATGPIDTREISAAVDVVTLRQPGIAGSAIINDRTTLLVDIDEMVARISSEWSDEPEL